VKGKNSGGAKREAVLRVLGGHNFLEHLDFSSSSFLSYLVYDTSTSGLPPHILFISDTVMG
jgi:hypothetical protein